MRNVPQSHIFHRVVPIGANCKVTEPLGAEPCWRRYISGEGLELSQSSPSCIHSLLPSPPHLPLWGWNRSVLLPVSACMHSCFFSHDRLPPSGTVRENKTFLSYIVLAMIFYQSNRKRKQLIHMWMARHTLLFFSLGSHREGVSPKGYLTHWLSVILMFTHKRHSLSYRRDASHFNGLR